MTRREKRANAFAQKTRDVAVAQQAVADAIDPADPFARPHVVGHIEAAMGASSTAKLMPAYRDIPEEFRDMNDRTVWNRLQSEWFFRGLPRDALGKPKPGIDRMKALAHLAAIQGSFYPAHEHKAAGVAYLMSRWFEE